VVDDLMRSGATLFGGAKEREALRRYLEGDGDGSPEGARDGDGGKEDGGA
jgi:hypothetical protein